MACYARGFEIDERFKIRVWPRQAQLRWHGAILASIRAQKRARGLVYIATAAQLTEFSLVTLRDARKLNIALRLCED